MIDILGEREPLSPPALDCTMNLVHELTTRTRFGRISWRMLRAWKHFLAPQTFAIEVLAFEVSGDCS